MSHRGERGGLAQARPRARTEGLDVVALPDEVLIYDTVRHRAHCLNGSAAFVWRQCDGRTPVSTIVRRLGAHTGRPADVEVVALALRQLEKARLLVGSAGTAAGRGLTRRELMKRVGTAAAVTLPVVASITAPTAASAASCVGVGGACPVPGVCCQGLVCTGTPPTCQLPFSDRTLKTGVVPVDPRTVLERVATLPIARWTYKVDDPRVRHIGPMAQDFAAAFGVGADDRHIHVVDASGVALAAIQGLHRLVEAQASEIRTLSREVTALRAGRRTPAVRPGRPAVGRGQAAGRRGRPPTGG
jgi:hypothetical protein